MMNRSGKIKKMYSELKSMIREQRSEFFETVLPDVPQALAAEIHMLHRECRKLHRIHNRFAISRPQDTH
jgi:hypothetical protein